MSIRRLFRRRGYKSPKSSRLVFLFIIIFLSAAVLGSSFKITPIVQTLGMSKAQQIGTRVIYESVNGMLDNSNIDYNDFVLFEKDNDGKITALKTNVGSINRIKSVLSIEILEKLAMVDTAKIGIPLGNIVNTELLSGRGPRIPIKLIPVGSVIIDVKNEFTSAGINQTRHQIFLDVTVHMTVILPGKNISTSANATVTVAETIIVGNVPQSYTYVTGDDSSTLEKINNYTDD